MQDRLTLLRGNGHDSSIFRIKQLEIDSLFASQRDVDFILVVGYDWDDRSRNRNISISVNLKHFLSFVLPLKFQIGIYWFTIKHI